MLQNFDIYFPVQLWKSRAGNYWRLQPPLLGFKDEYRFSPRFGTMSPEEFDDAWVLETTLWTMNPKYYLYLNRGFACVVVRQNNIRFPFESEKVSIFRSAQYLYSSIDEFKNSFAFCVYAYPIPGTRLLYIKNSALGTNPIMTLVFCAGGECPVEPGLLFLPNDENKQVSCYDIVSNNYNLFLYVFPERPLGKFFRLTSTGVCVPSTREEDFPTFYDCMRKSVEDRVLPVNTFLGSTVPELQQVMYTYPRVSMGHVLNVWPACFCFLSAVLVLLWLANNTQWRRTQRP